jgi:hypothetical protein
VLINIPLVPDIPLCRLLASDVRNFCRSVELDVLDEPSDDPSAVSRFWKSVSSELVLDDVSVVLASADVLSESELEAELVEELDVSDCARFSMADAKPPP